MVARQPSAKRYGSTVLETVRAAFSRNFILLETLELIFPNKAESLSFQDLRFQPFIAAHRNLVSVDRRRLVQRWDRLRWFEHSRIPADP
jgi:hypothetical protein